MTARSVYLQYGSCTRDAYAKINTYLEVLARREDGYHELCSHMQLITLCDTLTTRVERDEQPGIHLSLQTDCPALSCGEDNLILRAARAFFKGVSLPEKQGISVDFSLVKRIPMQGGLAGGSTDAAAALLALNTLCGEPYTEAELCTLGASLGADIPFCIRGLQGAQTATGIGEIMMPAPGIRPEVTLLVVLPGTAVSTPAAFRLLDELYGARDAAEREAENRTRYERHLDALQGGVLAELEMTSWNRFEEAVFALQPTTRQVFELVRSLGAPMTRMSGSGPTVVGYFDSAEMALAAQKTLMDAGYAAYLCHPLGDA